MFDEAALLEEFAGDEEILKEACLTFTREAGGLLGALAAALAGGEAAAVERAAHKFKGAAANFRAAALVDALHEVEKAAKRGDLAVGAARLAGLEGAVKELVRLLTALVAGRLGHDA